MQSNVTGLPELAARLAEERTHYKDFIAPGQRIIAHVPTGKEVVDLPEGTPLALHGLDAWPRALRPLAHRQLGERLGIPAKYYQRMMDSDGDLLAQNVRHWLARESKPLMIRCYKQEVRAVLSGSYLPLDHAFALDALLAGITDRMGVEMKSLALTDSRMYVQAVDSSTVKTITVQTPNYRGERERKLSMGFTFSNSEVGLGAFCLQEMVYNQWCSNLATFASVVRRTHLGARFQAEEAREWASNEAIVADMAALKLALRDAVRYTLDPGRLDERAALMQAAAEADQVITKPLAEVMEVTQRLLGLTDQSTHGVLEALMADGDFSRFGLHSAVTKHAQGVDADLGHELEVGSTKLLAMAKPEWAEVAQVQGVAL